MISKLSGIIMHWQQYINFVLSIIGWLGSMWVLYSQHYHLSGNRIPLWHRLPLLMVAFGFVWVAFTCMAGIFSNGESPFSYYYVGVIGELLVNAGIASIVVSFVIKALRKPIEPQAPIVKKVVRRRAGA